MKNDSVKYRTIRRSFTAGQIVSAVVSVPYLGMNANGESTRNWAHMTLSNPHGIKPRQVKRTIRKYILAALGRKIHPEELRMLMKRVEYSA